MGRSQKWPDLRSPISKIRDIRFVGTGDLIMFRKVHNFPWNIVAVARLESYFVVGSLDLTWWPDLTWYWVEIFTQVVEKMGGKVGENPTALRAAVFSLSSKNLRGGVQTPPPPPAGRGLIDDIVDTVGRIQNYETFSARHGVCINPLLYMGWCQAIPARWRHLLAGSPPVSAEDRVSAKSVWLNGKARISRLAKFSRVYCIRPWSPNDCRQRRCDG